MDRSSAVAPTDRRVPVVLVVTAMLSLLSGGCLGGRTDGDVGAQVLDRYGNAVPLSDASDVLYLSAQALLLDKSWGVALSEKCVAIGTMWVSDPEVPIPQGLTKSLISRLRALPADAYAVADEVAAANICPGKFTQYLAFQPLVLWKGRLYVYVGETAVGRMGGADYEYTFERANGAWRLVEGRSLRTSSNVQPGEHGRKVRLSLLSQRW